ncbi:MAG TPA: HK97 family phage prohead protease [Candidatus Dormibacteraeota bacterium]
MAGGYQPEPYSPDGDDVVVCPVCGRMDDDDAIYCDQCGTMLAGRTDVVGNAAEVNSADLSQLEHRSLPREGLIRAISGCEIRDAGDGDAGPGTLTGYLATFNQWTEIKSQREGHFMERMAPGAFQRTIADNGSRMKVTFNHGKDPQLGDKVLGIPSLLEEDDRGVRYEVPLLDTSYNRDLAPGLRAGAYGSSFRFNVAAEDYNKKATRSDYNPQGLPERTVRELHMQEFGPVTFPAYLGATAGMRSLTDRFAVDAHLRQREVDEFLLAIGM